MGSAGVASWAAQVIFCALLLLGLLWGDLGIKRALFFSPYVAVLDIALAFVVLKGDVRLS